MHDHYEILQVSPKAEPEVIQAAFKRLALKYHPDRNRDPQALEQMKLLNEAIAVLSDPQRRQEYDCVRAAGPEMRQKFVADAIAFGDDALARQEFVSAIRSYSQALDYEPSLAKAYHNRGIAHAGAGNFGQAVADISEAIRLAPLDPIAHRNRARAYQALGDIDLAKADLNQANRLTSAEPETASPADDQTSTTSDNSGPISFVFLSIAVATVTCVTGWAVYAVYLRSWGGLLGVCFAPWLGLVAGGILGGSFAGLSALLRRLTGKEVEQRTAINLVAASTAVAMASIVGVTTASVLAAIAAVAAGAGLGRLVRGTRLSQRFVLHPASMPLPNAPPSKEGSIFDYPMPAWCRLGAIVVDVPLISLIAFGCLLIFDSGDDVWFAIASVLGGTVIGATLGLWGAFLSWLLTQGLHHRIGDFHQTANKWGLGALVFGARIGIFLGLALACLYLSAGRAFSAVNALNACAGTAAALAALGYWVGYLAGIAVCGFRHVTGRESVPAVIPGGEARLGVHLSILVLLVVLALAFRQEALKHATPNLAHEAIPRTVLQVVVNDRLEVTGIPPVPGGGNEAFEVGDRIIAFADMPVGSKGELERAVDRFRPGATLSVHVVRGGVIRKFETQLAVENAK